jgi:hypothetical protein
MSSQPLLFSQLYDKLGLVMLDPTTQGGNMSQLIITECHGTDRTPPRWVTPTGPYSRGYMSSSSRSYNAKPRLYVFVEGENILENLAFRTNRPSKLYRTILKEAFRRLGLPETTKAYWSQKAGCSCGCSPGFILEGSGAGPKDFFVTVTSPADITDAKVVPSAEAMDEAASRLSQLEQQGVLDALRASAPVRQSGRSAEGRLRNFKAMTEDKFLAVAKEVAAEDNDPEAQAALKEEAYRRYTV